jgi:tRNA (guanine37-N1)-methyltransferase
VPEVLRGGNHAEIDAWRAERALERTRQRRPDLARAIDEKSATPGPARRDPR